MSTNRDVEDRRVRLRERVAERERARTRAREARDYTRSTTRPPFEDVRVALDTATRVTTLAARTGEGMDEEGVQAVLGALLTARALMDRADVMTAPEGREAPGRDPYATMGGTDGGCTHENALSIPSMGGGAAWVCECGASGEVPEAPR